MGAPKKVTRQAILRAASEILGKEGYSAINARSVAKKLGCSTQPIYAAFSGGMEELKDELKRMAEERYRAKAKEYLSEGNYNAYKSYGLGYVRFAREEKQLFRLLYTRSRGGEKRIEDVHLSEILDLLEREYGYDRETAAKFHEDMSVYSYGLAVLVNTGFSDFSDEEISEHLQRQFLALTGVYGIPPKWKKKTKEQGKGKPFREEGE